MGAVEAPTPATASVRLEGVELRYPGRAQAVLKAVDLELSPGETVALVGPSGAGKSSIAALLLGLVRPSRGRVAVGDVDLASCGAESWHRFVAWVPQRPSLVRASVRENILLGGPASDERLHAAAALAGVDEVVRRLPDGYETVVGDGGRPLSAGEARRIALARAFLRDAPFVILDEPTADLDTVSAEIVTEAIERLRAGRTVLLIAHRPELARRADRTVTLTSDGVLTSPLAEAV